MTNIDLTRSSRKGWALIRKLGGSSKLTRNKPRINADRIARRIVRSSKAPSNRTFSRKINSAYKGIRKATPSSSEYSSQITAEEVNTALLYLKNAKASGFDSVYTEFLIYSCPRTRLWLARFSSNSLAANLPPAFKKTKIILLQKPGKPEDTKYRIATFQSHCHRLRSNCLNA